MLAAKTWDITPDMLDQLTDLILDAAEADGEEYTLPDDADFFIYIYDDGKSSCTVLAEPDDISSGGAAPYADPDALACVMAVYMMGETLGGADVCELSVFTAPSWRGKGYFREALRILRRDMPGAYFRFAVYSDTAFAGVLESIGAEYDHDELIMELVLEGTDADEDRSPGLKAEPEIRSEYIEDPDEGSFEEGTASTPYSECRFRIFESFAYVYGILTYESRLRQGHAAALLRGLFEYLRSRDVLTVRLEVSSDNTPAVRLYDKLGFESAESLSYYYLAPQKG